MPEMLGIYTETLARLYLKQGFPDRAVAIYRQLVQEQPENQALLARLQHLERQMALGILSQERATAPAALPTASHAPRPRLHAHTIRPAPEPVIAQLERWLQYLQRQRLQRVHSLVAQHGEA